MLQDPTTIWWKFLRYKSHILFIVTDCRMDEIGGQKVVVNKNDDILVIGIKVHSFSKGVINDILIW